VLIAPKQALDIVLKFVAPLEITNQPLDSALGRYLAEDVHADRDLPPTDRSAMDGFAVRSSDIARCPCELTLSGEVAAGSALCPAVEPGACVRILTGGVVPPGADTVVMVEDTKEKDGSVTFLKSQSPRVNIRFQGEEIRKGKAVLSRGAVLNPAQIGLCASVGKVDVDVFRSPKVLILCTGSELLPASSDVLAHQLRDSNGPALRGALKISGFNEFDHHIVPDDPERLADRITQGVGEYDVIIITGGVSVGKYDYAPEAVRKAGAVIRYHGVAMKPGKPQLYATLDGNRHIFGLPGNPLSVMTGFYEFTLPALRRLSGAPIDSCRPALRLPLDAPVRCKGKGGRTELVLARLVWDVNGSRVRPVDSHGSADLVAGAKADGAIKLGNKEREVPAGTLVEFVPWRPLL